MKKLTQEEFIERSKLIHKEKYSYQNVNYVNSRTEIPIYCNGCCVFFNQKPIAHMSGNGHKKCSMKFDLKERQEAQAKFIAKSIIMHGNKYSYENVEYFTSKIPVSIWCNKCCIFFDQQPYDHMNGRGCRSCQYKNAKITTEEFIVKATIVHSGKYSYQNVNYTHSHNEVEIWCNECNSFFEQKPSMHLFGIGHTNCVAHIRNKAVYKTTEQFISEAVVIHKDKYLYHNVDYINDSTKVSIWCNSCNDFFDQSPNSHLQGCGCEQCGINAKKGKFKKTTEQFISEAIEIHKGKFDYALVEYKGVKSDVLIKCNECFNIFSQIASVHLNGFGCPYCAHKRIDTLMFIERAIEIHKYKYDYSKSIYIRTGEPLIIFCKTCNVDFNQMPCVHLRGGGCEKCANNAKTKTLEQFITQATGLHKKKYDYSLVNYINGTTLVDIICNKCGIIFQQKPENHLKNQGCSSCKYKANYNVSKQETLWLDSLNIPIEYRNINIYVDNKRYNVDAYDSNTNTIYEFYGDFWHGNPELYASDQMNRRSKKTYGEAYTKTMIRENCFRKAGYNVIIIWENDWNKQNKEEEQKNIKAS